MSDFLGVLLGMSPHQGFGLYDGVEATTTNQARVANDLRLAANMPTPQGDWSGALNALAPPLPEPGIHWTRTGGKAWRVVIVR